MVFTLQKIILSIDDIYNMNIAEMHYTFFNNIYKHTLSIINKFNLNKLNLNNLWKRWFKCIKWILIISGPFSSIKINTDNSNMYY